MKLKKNICIYRLMHKLPCLNKGTKKTKQMNHASSKHSHYNQRVNAPPQG